MNRAEKMVLQKVMLLLLQKIAISLQLVILTKLIAHHLKMMTMSRVKEMIHQKKAIVLPETIIAPHQKILRLLLQKIVITLK
ncbi:hypothetical protein ABD07_06425 [Nitrosomonas oligotropha]|nr:hypothetical protein [Nitrosomonas oligotropha]